MYDNLPRWMGYLAPEWVKSMVDYFESLEKLSAE
jgi:hypothetical protein